MPYVRFKTRRGVVMTLQAQGDRDGAQAAVIPRLAELMCVEVFSTETENGVRLSDDFEIGDVVEVAHSGSEGDPALSALSVYHPDGASQPGGPPMQGGFRSFRRYQDSGGSIHWVLISEIG